VRRNVTKRGGGNDGDGVRDGIMAYFSSLLDPNPNQGAVEPTPMLPITTPITTQMALTPTTRTNEGTTQIQEEQLQPPGTTDNGPNGGKRRGRRNRKRTRRGGGVSVSPYEAPMNAAPISNIQMAQPLTMVGGKSKKKRRSGKKH